MRDSVRPMGHPMAAALVRQREEKDCGIAAAAMATGLSYEAVRAVADELGLFDPGEGMWFPRMHRLLESASGVPWDVERPWPVRPFGERHSGEGFPDGAVVLVRLPESRGEDPGHYRVWRGRRMYFGPAHWIVVRGGRVLDPYLARPMTPNRYGYSSWDVVRVLTPRADGRVDAGRSIDGRSAR